MRSKNINERDDKMRNTYHGIPIHMEDEDPRPKGEGGYLLPYYIWRNKPGVMARIWRILGIIFENEWWYERGRQKCKAEDLFLIAADKVIWQ
jgi:hypothetical protein